tara:strand:- start:153 stop:305 length:153 start_codon:yes stop_codon:yes gene_type:complete
MQVVEAEQALRRQEVVEPEAVAILEVHPVETLKTEQMVLAVAQVVYHGME